MQLIFPQFYFQYSFDGHKKIKEKILKKYLKNEKFKTVESWNCNSKITHITDLSDLDSLFQEIFYKFSSEVKQKLQLSVENAWINLYNKGDFQEIHHHLPNSTFSMVYFLEYNKNIDSNFYFYNTDSSSFSVCKLNNIFSHNLIGDNFSPDVEEGDVIIFPSHLHHGVKPQVKDKKRITLSCNFTHSVVQ